MNKKIVLLIICLILTTACDNQNNHEKNNIKSLCNQIKNDITNYQNNKITKEELYSKLENYNDTCSNLKTNICINLKVVISIPKEREDLQKEYLMTLLDDCQNK